MVKARHNGKNVALMGLSGVGKTRATNKLREVRGERIKTYSVDEAIWTGRSALREDFERWAGEVNRYIGNVAANSLAVTADYLGMLGDPAQGGLPESEFRRRQALHAEAERSAVLQVNNVVKRPGDWVIDLSGSFCEVVQPWQPDDQVLRAIERHCRSLLIEATPEHLVKLYKKQQSNPKPLYYRPEFLDKHIPDMLDFYNVGNVEALAPSAVSDFLYPKLMQERMARYAAIVGGMGGRAVKLPMLESQALQPQELDDLLAA